MMGGLDAVRIEMGNANEECDVENAEKCGLCGRGWEEVEVQSGKALFGYKSQGNLQVGIKQLKRL